MLKSILKMVSVSLLTWNLSPSYQISWFMTIKLFGYQKFCKLNGKTSKVQAWVPLLRAWCELSLKVQGKRRFICNYSECNPWLHLVFLAALHPRISLDPKSEFVNFTVMQLQLTELNSWFILLIFTEAFASVAPGSWCSAACRKLPGTVLKGTVLRLCAAGLRMWMCLWVALCGYTYWKILHLWFPKIG